MIFLKLFRRQSIFYMSYSIPTKIYEGFGMCRAKGCLVFFSFASGIYMTGTSYLCHFVQMLQLSRKKIVRGFFKAGSAKAKYYETAKRNIESSLQLVS